MVAADDDVENAIKITSRMSRMNRDRRQAAEDGDQQEIHGEQAEKPQKHGHDVGGHASNRGYADTRRGLRQQAENREWCEPHDPHDDHHARGLRRLQKIQYGAPVTNRQRRQGDAEDDGGDNDVQHVARDQRFVRILWNESNDRLGNRRRLFGFA